MNDLVSIIVPAYQAEATIGRCIESVLAQSYGNWELVAIDDGSTDATSSILESYRNDCGKVKIVNQSNQGRCVARNAGLAISRGTWISFLDADDFLSPCALDTLLAGASSDTIGVWANCMQQEPKCSPEREPCVVAASDICKAMWNQSDRLELVSGSAVVIENKTAIRTVWGKLYSSNAVKARRVSFTPGLRFGEDFVFNASFLSGEGNVDVIPDYIYSYDTTASKTVNCYSELDGVCLIRLYEAAEKTAKIFCDELSEGCIDSLMGSESINVFKRAACSEVPLKELCESLQIAFKDERIVSALVNYPFEGSFLARMRNYLRFRLLEKGRLKESLVIERMIEKWKMA